MDVKSAIETRRAYRALESVPITDEIIEELARSAQLSPSCFNKQPWNFIFVRSPEMLEQIHPALRRGNKWVEAASLIIVVYTKKDLDCMMPGRDYYLFDTGMSTAFLILRATELGLVAHPIAGFDPKKVKKVLGISDEMTVITLVNVGKHSTTNIELLNEQQLKIEEQRPQRKPIEEFIRII
ncbi:MAG: nitroreductase family protein [Candidatus Odinarchaeota archaeon]